MSKELIERLRKHWTDWGSPTDRDAEFDQGIMAIDCNEAAARIAHLESIVERLAKTADGVEVLPDDVVYVLRYADEDTKIAEDKIAQPHPLVYDGYGLSRCYSTRAAAESARAKEPTHAD